MTYRQSESVLPKIVAAGGKKQAQVAHGYRDYKAYSAARLDGDWTPLAATKDLAFASISKSNNLARDEPMRSVTVSCCATVTINDWTSIQPISGFSFRMCLAATELENLMVRLRADQVCWSRDSVGPFRRTRGSHNSPSE